MGRYARFRQAVLNRFRTAARNFNFNPWVSKIWMHAENFAEEHYPQEPLTSAAPNMGHDTDSYSSDWALLVDHWTRALTVALTGRLMRGDIDVTEGHKHDNYRTDLEWREVARFSPLGDNQGTGGPPESKGLIYIDDAAVSEALNCMFHVDDQFNSLDMFVRIAQPAPGSVGGDGWLEISAELYDLNTSTTTLVKTLANPSIQSIAAGLQFPNKWMGPIPVDLRDCASVRGLRWVLVRVSVRVRAGGTLGGLYEVVFTKPRR